jgi:glycosyltransferase involved in cell wall biosynthesis
MVVTISEHARRGMVERLGIDADRVVAVPLAVDHDRFRSDASDADGDLDLPDRYLLYPANDWPHKNHERLIRAFAAVPDPDLALVLTGETYGRSLAGVPGDRVRHLGHVPREALPTLYRRAVALVFPSLFEGFGLPVLEAMACGCPVASSDAGALEEIAAGAALLFDAHSEGAITEAIRRIAADEALRDELRARGLRRAAGYTWTAAAERHVAAYEAALRR